MSGTYKVTCATCERVINVSREQQLCPECKNSFRQPVKECTPEERARVVHILNNLYTEE